MSHQLMCKNTYFFKDYYNKYRKILEIHYLCIIKHKDSSVKPQ